MTSLFNEQATIAVRRSEPSAQAAQEKTAPTLDLSSAQSLINNLQIYGNPLLNTGSELLALLVSLPRQVSPLDIDAFRQQLFDAVADFKRNGLFLDYHPSVIEKSCFVFCAAFDETILYTSWGEQSRWENHSLLSKIFNQRDGGEVFFNLLEQARRQPSKLVDFLELQYVLIMLGFLGKYRHNERHRINELQSELYTVIGHYRQDTKLSVPKTPNLPKVKKPWCFLSVPKLLLISLLIFVGSSLFSQLWYKNRSESTLLAFSNLDMNELVNNKKNSDFIYISTAPDIGLIDEDKTELVKKEVSNPIRRWDILLAVFSDPLDGERLAKDLKDAGYNVKLNETANGMELIVPNQTNLTAAKSLQSELNVNFGFNALVRKNRQQE
jgi:type VI secretion system protein ImpK